jgi:hypothetical protein
LTRKLLIAVAIVVLVAAGLVGAYVIKERTYALTAARGKQVWSFADSKYSPLVTDGKRPFLICYARVFGLLPRRRSR